MLLAISFITSLIFSIYYKSKVIEDNSKDSELTSKEKLIVLLTTFLSPVIAGAVYYYGWKKKLPIKARQANKYSWLMVGAYIIFQILFTDSM